MNNYFLKALNQENEAPYIPVWLLRQAGRYMPEYREVRSQYKDFFEMIKKPELCKELTLQPLNACDLDAALTDCCIEYAKRQVQHGADCIQIFDSWAGILENNYVDFSLKYVNQIYEALNGEVPLILYNRGKLLSTFIHESSFKAYSINSSDQIENYIDDDITIQGNLNPDFFKKNEEEIELKAHEIFTKFKDRKNYIFNVGEGLTPDLDPEKIKIFLKTLRSLNSQ